MSIMPKPDDAKIAPNHTLHLWRNHAWMARMCPFGQDQCGRHCPFFVLDTVADGRTVTLVCVPQTPTFIVYGGSVDAD